MLEKIKGCFSASIRKLPHFKLDTANMWIIGAYGFICALLLVIFATGWLYNFAVKDITDLDILKAMFDSLTDPQCVAAVTFLAIFSVDKDKDGISDAVEEHLEEKNKNNSLE